MLWKLARSIFEPRPDRQVARALELRRRGDLAAAEQLLRRIVAQHPNHAEAIINLGVVLVEQNRAADGAAMLERGLVLDAGNAAAHYNLATLLRVSGYHDQAIRHYAVAADLPQSVPQVRQELMFALLEVCDWSAAQRHADLLSAHCAARTDGWMQSVAPLTAVYLALDQASCRQVAAWHANEAARDVTPVSRRTGRARTERKRIGYLSPDFRDHPVGHLMSAVLQLHDRSSFEVFVYSYGPDDGSEYRQRIAAGADRFVDVAPMSDEVAARAIAGDKVQLLIDLAGHTSGGRLGIVARRPAPVQAHYLGHPGTTGADYIDYFIGDNIVTPPDLADSFSERLVRVPECFMVGGGPPSAGRSSRAAEGLPEGKPVYASFTNGSRITRDVFTLWMEILRDVPGSLLWLSNARAEANLRNAAHDAGVDPHRLVFAKRKRDKADHVARLPLADLGLDTIGWHNGHSTTHDMLWAGLPVLTTVGRTFASCVGASLVTAAGMPELVARDARHYVEMAVRIGNDPSERATLKRKLAKNRGTAPLFSTRGLVRDLESVYREIWQSWVAASPRTISPNG
jgi:protein O-GlcNAc transferase